MTPPHWVVPGIQKPISTKSIFGSIHRVAGLKQNNKSRLGKLVIARQVEMTITYIFSDMTLAAVGDLYEKDHATVLHSINAIRDAVDTNDKEIMVYLLPIFERYYQNYIDNLTPKTEQKRKIRIRLRKYKFTERLITMLNLQPCF